MPYDKVVNSTQLNSDLTSVANAIRAKGGTSAALAFPGGFVDAVGAIPAAGTNWLKYITGIQYMFMGVDFGIDDVVLDFEDASITGYGSCVYSFSQIKLQTLTIKNLIISNKSMLSFMNGAGNHYSVNKLRFVDCIVQPSSIQNFVNAQRYITSIDGEIDLEYCTNMTGSFANCDRLTSIRIKNNSIKIDAAGLNMCPWDDATLVNLGNALDGTVTGKTITLSATCKARCTTLMGTNDNGTFIADESGTMSLETFITTVKGWTLA